MLSDMKNSEIDVSKCKVDNAIIMAAGMSSRFAPLCYEIPKGLLPVKGEVLIERQIRQLHEVGIKDITVVAGYIVEKFFYLKEKFGVSIVVNEDYHRYNNTSSLFRVMDRLKNTYICSSDNYFTENPFEPCVGASYYSALYADGRTGEYCIETDSEGKIENVYIGGENSWYMMGHVYFSRDLSERFCKILKAEYKNEETRLCLWEDLYIRHIKELPLYIRKYESGAIMEFDTLDDLRLFDSSYVSHVDSKVFRNIKSVLKCNDEDIKGIQTLKNENGCARFLFFCEGRQYSYSHKLKDDGISVDVEGEDWSVEKRM